MSQDLVGIRRQLKQVSSFLRQGKAFLAVQYVLAAVRLVLTTTLMKNEREEMIGMITEAVGYLGHDKGLRNKYPLALEYRPGQEKQLFDQLTELLTVLNEETMAEAEAIAATIAAKKEAALAKGQEHLDAERYDDARVIFTNITGEYPDDNDLKVAVGEKVLNAGLYKDAVDYFTDVVNGTPPSIYNYNKLAIALRKLGHFDMAEGYYLQVLPLASDDAYLLFNVGRLYLEWGRWREAVDFGERAMAIKPDFAEAGKLASFARKKLSV